MNFKGIPSFSPEIFKTVINTDPMKTKQLQKGLKQLCEEGVSQLFTKHSDQRMVLGTVGALQFEVIQYRLKNEYSAECRFEELSFVRACWLSSDNKSVLDDFIKSRQSTIAVDEKGNPVFLAETQWRLDRERQENPDIKFHFTSEME